MIFSSIERIVRGFPLTVLMTMRILECLDLKLFNASMEALIHGQPVVLPTYDFKLGEKRFVRETADAENGSDFDSGRTPCA